MSSNQRSEIQDPCKLLGKWGHGQARETCCSLPYGVGEHWNVQVELEAVRPGEGESSEEELRLSIAVLPLRLRIDQAVVDFCQVGCCSICQGRGPHGVQHISCRAADEHIAVLPLRLC